jgi:F-type H+-transporting ATPase subunit b
MRIDWSTLALQTVNVVVLLWLLKRFLFRPVADIIAARRKAAADLLDEAAAARAAAKARAAELARRIAASEAAADARRAEAAEAADAERARRLAEAGREIDRLRTAAARALRQDRARARRELEDEAGRLAGTIAARLLAHLPGPAATAAILAGLGDVLAALPAPQREALAAGAAPIEVVSATPLSDAEQARCTAMLTQHLGLATPPRYRADAGLLAGIELHGSGAMLRHSWQAQLERIMEELARKEAGDAATLA